MKSYLLTGFAAASLLSIPPLSHAAAPGSPFVYETAREFFASGDFDGDGNGDVVIVDKDTGKLRLGYQQTPGAFNWVDNRPTGIKGVSGVSLGPVLGKTDAVSVTSPDAGQISISDVSSSSAPARPKIVAFEAALGPSAIVAADIGGDGNTPELDFVVGSIYNSPDENQATLLRNEQGELTEISTAAISGKPSKANRVQFAPDRSVAAMVISGDDGDVLQFQDLSSGSLTVAGSVSDLPAGSDYIVGAFGSGGLDLVTYKQGENSIFARSLSESGGKVQVTEGKSYDLGQPVRRVMTLNTESPRLFVIFGEGQKAAVYNYDGAKEPSLVQGFSTTNEYTAAAATAKGLVLFAQASGGKFSTRYETYVADGSAYTPGAFGSLPNLADNDNVTIPEIHARIVKSTGNVEESAMSKYTNTIPGTRVNYVMVPIKGGEFLMGSPESETDRKADEGPQFKVKVAPFWMGQFEVTWNEYELFMYPDEERRTRALVQTDAAGDKLADAVTHPSKPYVEMSFGMGKDGYPAISMTQHAANKYCQWLSAKTGHFYRLPTEAEWEYACRAGTTGKHFFGDDEAKLPEYGWFEENSDFKYQKVGKKKPNPWGLYDIYGNVVEWVLDQYDPEWYAKCAEKNPAINPWNKATKPYPHSVRGGSWDDQAKMLRSAARRGSERAWKMQDPQLPKSVWYFSDAQWVGFRVVRPLEVPSSEEMQKYWTSGVEKD